MRTVLLLVVGVFATLWMKEKLSWNHAAAAVCLVGAAYFTFRK